MLNEFYASDLDTYQSGRVVYPFSDLEEGPHTLELKAWDVHNNSAKATLDFVVVSDLEVFLDGLVNYPNPMDRRGTTFRFDHNQACVALAMSLSVYDSMGNVVWQGEREETPRDTEWTDGIGMGQTQRAASFARALTSTV